MPSVTYSGSFDGARGSNGATVSVSGASIPSGATIKIVDYSLRVKANKYTSSEDWHLVLFAVDEDSPEVYGETETMYSSDYTFRGAMDFEQSDVSRFSDGTFDVYAEAYSTYDDATTYLWEFTITVEYDTYSKCGAPSNVKLSSATSTGDHVALSWGAASNGNDNAVSYYQIARKESTNGSSWGALTMWNSNAGKVTKYNVPPPSTPGNYYLYFVRAVGTAGTSYASDWAQCSGTLRNPPIADCAPPRNLALSTAATSGTSATLTWEAGGGGTHNALSYYQIARAESADGATWGERTIYSANVGNVTTYSVPAPAQFGHRYRYYVRAVGAKGEGYASAWAECAQTLEKLRPDMSTYTDPTITPGETPIKAVHITELQTNVNLLRASMGLTEYAFSAIRAGYTSLAGWSSHIAELRAALDEITTTHEAWLEITENKPRADVLLQLRQVVASI